ncbi:MAG: phosphoribosylaminoimidazolesuccinocarboxamide synthase [Rhodospirillaceae bacterium]|nr:phosphoribosylaminoimidazolesuccinocarboxamide synthase [Rhodospirillaceae bacterium]|tara:strand:- start:158 stop:1051 length:894 start_codon:yes stop_codon:yes gene_type:complete
MAFDQLHSLPLAARGKVRDVYDLGDRLLMVASDRISAFDVVMPTAILDKGRLLNGLSLFWFDRLDDVVPNHIITTEFDGLDVSADERAWLDGRAVVVKKAEVLPVECIARGYVIGSGWKDYQATGSISGIALPEGLQQAEKLPEPIFTPSTKAAVGDHDVTISFDDMVDLVGPERAEQARAITLQLYNEAAAYAAERGIILADTKFEMGLVDGELILIDECLTSDSSRYWPADEYRPGISPPSFDKQFVRDWLETLDDWNKSAPGPELPAAIVEKTRARYVEAYERLTGRSFESGTR